MKTEAREGRGLRPGSFRIGWGRCAALLLISILFVSGELDAQQVIEGRVADALSAQPLEGVQVRATTFGVTVVTDARGAFTLSVPDSATVLQLEFSRPEYDSLTRGWLLPLARPIVLGLQRDVIELEGVRVDVMATVVEDLDARLARITATTRAANSAELRAFPHQAAEIWDFLPRMRIATTAACDSCFIMNGPFTARFFVDDFEVSYEEFRSYRVGEICRVDAVRIPPRARVPPPPSMFEGRTGGVLLYTCRYLADVVRGRKRLPTMLPAWWGMG